MAINKFMKLALKALSYPDIDIRKIYQLRDPCKASGRRRSTHSAGRISTSARAA